MLPSSVLTEYGHSSACPAPSPHLHGSEVSPSAWESWARFSGLTSTDYVIPHLPQPGKGGAALRWPKAPSSPSAWRTESAGGRGFTDEETLVHRKTENVTSRCEEGETPVGPNPRDRPERTQRPWGRRCPASCEQLWERGPTAPEGANGSNSYNNVEKLVSEGTRARHGTAAEGLLSHLGVPGAAPEQAPSCVAATPWSPPSRPAGIRGPLAHLPEETVLSMDSISVLP